MTYETTTRRRLMSALGAAAGASLAGCAGSGVSNPSANDDTPLSEPKATTTEPTTATATPTADTAESPTVAMLTDNKGSYFDPKGLLVELGTTVRFVNESGAHNTSAYHPDTGDVPLRIPEAATPWQSDLFSESGKTFDVTLTEPGVYDYYCTPHEVLGMVGRIVVGEPADGPGTTPPDDLPPAARESLPPVEEILANGSVAGP